MHHPDRLLTTFPCREEELISTECYETIICVKCGYTVYFLYITQMAHMLSRISSRCFSLHCKATQMSNAVLKETDILLFILCIISIFIHVPSPCGLSVLCFCLMYVKKVLVAHLIPRDMAPTETSVHWSAHTTPGQLYVTYQETSVCQVTATRVCWRL